MENIILHVYYRSKNGTAEDFVRTVKESGTQDKVRAEDGCIQYDYHLSLEECGTVVLLEKWRDSEALAAHMQHPNMAVLRELKERYALETVLERYE